MKPSALESGKPIYFDEYKSQVIFNDGWMMRFVQPMPCAWWRFWYFVLLGWKWEKLGK